MTDIFKRKTTGKSDFLKIIFQTKNKQKSSPASKPHSGLARKLTYQTKH